VQDILHTVNSVPTLEQKLESSFLNCENTKQKSQMSRMDTNSISSISFSNNNLPVSLSATLSQSLPGSSYAQTNILYTTLAGTTSSKILSLVDGSHINKNHLVIENLEDHSPEIQAELLNALLADEPYQMDDKFRDEVCHEEVYRINTLPSSWWVLKKRKQGGLTPEITYYSPQGLAFKNKVDIQNFLQHDLIPRETKLAGIRQAPIPLDSIPVINEEFSSVQQPNPSLGNEPSNALAIDTNSIAQVLIASLKPEPIENLQDNRIFRDGMDETINLEMNNPNLGTTRIISKI